MIIIGERLNSSRRPVLEALRAVNEEYILRDARAQHAAGASYIDVNAAALLGREVETLKWIIPLLQRGVGAPLAIDTPNVEAMEAGLRLHEGQAVLNSLSGEARRLERLLPVIRERKPRVIVLCLDDAGMPDSSDKEVAIAQRMVDLLAREGTGPGDIFIDPLVRPVATDEGAVRLFLESLEKIKQRLPDVPTVAGISNVSFGLPERKVLNRTLLMLALERGLDAAIIDPLDKDMLGASSSTDALLGRDPGLRRYLALMRKKKPRPA